MIFVGIINWFKEIFSSRDEGLIGLSQIKEPEIIPEKVSEIKKVQKDVKISDLMKGELSG